MADNPTVSNDDLTDYKVSADEDATNGFVQRVKLAYSADGSSTHVTADVDGVLVNLGANNDVVVSDGGNVISVDDGSGSLTVDNAVISVVGGGTEAAAQRVTIATDSTGVLSVDDNGGNLSIDDGGNSITVDNAVISVVGGGTEAAAQRVTIATDSTGVLSVDDNGGSLTVDGTLTANPQRTATATLTNVADQATNINLLASTAGRLGASFFNDSTEILYLKLGTTASATSFTVKIQPDGFYELPHPVYTGNVDGLWANNASGSVRITELT